MKIRNYDDDMTLDKYQGHAIFSVAVLFLAIKHKLEDKITQYFIYLL